MAALSASAASTRRESNMAALSASAASTRRESSFLDAAESEGASAEWAAMLSSPRVEFNDGPPTAGEAVKLSALREKVDDLCSAAR